MLVNILIFAIAAIFSVYVFYSACRKYIGHNPEAPSLWARVKAWWPGFVKRHIVDDDPYQDEGHAATRYAEAQGHWHNINIHGCSPTGAPSSPVDGVTGLPRNTCPHCDAPIHAGEYVDWSKVPDGYDWVAVDEDRYISWFVRKPEIGSYSNQWIVDRMDRIVDYDLDIMPAFIIGPLPPWRDSLRHRPGK